jgi:hypothetical protein
VEQIEVLTLFSAIEGNGLRVAVLLSFSSPVASSGALVDLLMKAARY